MCLHTRNVLAKLRHRSKIDQAVRACHTNKMKALAYVLRDVVREAKCVVFCDSPFACREIHKIFPNSVRMTGQESPDERRTVLTAFGNDVDLLFTTRVCDAGIDFPDGAFVVQLYSSSGSRQQEVQRAGRGMRDAETRCRMVHIVNANTEEGMFMARRIEHMQQQPENSVSVEEIKFDPAVTVSSDGEDQAYSGPMEVVTSLKIRLRPKIRAQQNRLRKRFLRKSQTTQLKTSVPSSGTNGQS